MKRRTATLRTKRGPGYVSNLHRVNYAEFRPLPAALQAIKDHLLSLGPKSTSPKQP